MKPKNGKATLRLFVGGVAVMFIAGILLLACNKNAAGVKTTAAHDDITQIAEIVQGKVFAGSISSHADDSMLSINYNNGSQFVLVQDMPGLLKVDVPTLASATLITSIYGVIVNDAATGKTILLANNDAESIQKFEEVKAALKGSYTSTLVYGVTYIHAEKS